MSVMGRALIGWSLIALSASMLYLCAWVVGAYPSRLLIRRLIALHTASLLAAVYFLVLLAVCAAVFGVSASLEGARSPLVLHGCVVVFLVVPAACILHGIYRYGATVGHHRDESGTDSCGDFEKPG